MQQVSSIDLYRPRGSNSNIYLRFTLNLKKRGRTKNKMAIFLLKNN